MLTTPDDIIKAAAALREQGVDTIICSSFILDEAEFRRLFSGQEVQRSTSRGSVFLSVTMPSGINVTTVISPPQHPTDPVTITL